ncbi:MAG: C4-dicarboxylate ABC transporter substrate-binding protein, partial [Deltaproteobacteria bacterium]|nr:C4-dicarboxylate ABC transporter substrate-binding protein [Deltaproteobacteria bacterium]
MKKIYLLVLLIMISAAAAAAEIKMAVVAPEGSTWVNILREWAKALQAKTQGRLKLTIYAGGV